VLQCNLLIERKRNNKAD